MKKTIAFVASMVTTFVVLFLECSVDRAVSATEPLRGNCMGIIRDAGGAPVADARVLLVPHSYSRQMNGDASDSSLDSTETDDNGRYAFSVKVPGKYNVLAKKDALYSLRQAIPLSAHTGVELGDTLKAPGSVSGTVHLQGRSDHHSAIVLFIGTNLYTMPFDTAGNFSMTALAQGSYTVRVLTTESDFAVVETTILVTSGTHTTVPLIECAKTTISMSGGLLTNYDPAMMTVTLSWNPVDTALISGYALYCNRSKNLTPVITLPNYRSTHIFDLALSPIDTFTYQIAAVGNGGLEGPAITAKTFVKTSFVTLSNIIRYQPPSVRSGEYSTDSLYVDNSENIYLSTASDIFKMDSTGAILAHYQVVNDTEGFFQSNLKGDASGNLYILRQTSGGVSLVRFDANLHVRSEVPLPLVTVTFTVSGSGVISVLYNDAAGGEVTAGSTPRMMIDVYDSDCIKLNTYTAPAECSSITSAICFMDTVVTFNIVNQTSGGSSWGISYRDNAFTMLSSIADLDFLKSYLPDDFWPDGFYALGPKGIIASRYYPVYTGNPDDLLYLFFNSQKQVIARIPGTMLNSGFGTLCFSKSGNIYVSPGDGRRTHAIYKYSTDQLVKVQKE